MIDVQKLLEAVSAEEPSGPNLEYDKAFQELERIAQFKPEQEIGKTIVPAEEPDWRAVEKAAAELLERSKDLRVVNHLTKAVLHTGGMVGLAQGLRLMRGLVEQYWSSFHPQLDPDDDNDPTLRVNILAELCDQSTYLSWVRTAPLASVKGLGSASLRDLQIATGEMPPPASATTKPLDQATIDAIFSASELEALQAAATATAESIEHVARTETAVTEAVGVDRSQSLGKFRALLDQVKKVLDKYVSQRGSGVTEAIEGGAAGETKGEGGASGSGVARLSGEIHSREDVLKALDKILDYYNRHEPSSPIPLLVQRCKKLIPMNFLDIVRNLAPDGVSQVELIRGPTEEEDGSQ